MNNANSTIQMIVGVLAICATVGGGAKYIGEEIYSFAKAQTLLIEHVRGAEKAISGLGDDQKNLKAGLDKEHDDADKASRAAMTAAKAAADLIPPIQSDITELKKLAQTNLDVSNSHTKPIEETRKALKGSEPR